MTSRPLRPARPSVAPVHRGPGAHGAHATQHAPNAALLIDFDNVTMGIRSDLQTELRNLLSSDIIHGKVAVQRAYADWRRYPQYIVPLSESSIDLIFAPAYGSSKKNATDIRLAVDAIEIVFTRPEIGTFILLSGDSDFSSLVLKLKEYGKYVIGVGIRESSSDLLVQNCDEYYSYNALAGLVRAGEDESVKRDPWELVAEAIQRMAKNGDVMRSDRLKQVMQEIDASFDEKDLGFSKFSKFAQEAGARGLLTVSRLDNGQLEVAPARAEVAPEAAPARVREEERGEERGRRGRRGRRGGRDREERGERPPRESIAEVVSIEESAAPAEPAPREERPAREGRPPRAGRQPVETRVTGAPAAPVVGRAGERLTRAEAFDLVRRATTALVGESGDAARAGDVRLRAFDLLGRDSESLSERNWPRILKDAHDADVIDLRRRGDDFEVALAVVAAPIAEQLNVASAAIAPREAETAAPPAPRGMTPRGLGARGGRGGFGRVAAAPPPDLFSVGVVDVTPVASAAAPPIEPVAAPAAVESTAAPEEAANTRPRRGAAKRPAKTASKRARAAKTAAKAAAAPTAAPSPAPESAPMESPPAAPAKRGRPRKAAAKKSS